MIFFEYHVCEMVNIINMLKSYTLDFVSIMNILLSET